MDIYFYSINKRHNSTKLPTGSGTKYECYIKDSCSILTPTIKLDIGVTTSPIIYNYAYIPDWNRYYYISNWTFATRLWEASLTVDVLATYKTQIGNFNAYVLRSASRYDGTLIDTTYPQKVGITGHQNHIFGTDSEINPIYYQIYRYGNSSLSSYRNSSLDGANPGTGYYYVTLIGEDSTGTYYYTTYCMSWTNFFSLMYHMVNIDYSSYDKGTLTNDVYKYIADPLQWIVQIKWSPFEIPTTSSMEKTYIKFGPLSNTTISVTCKDVTGAKGMRIVTSINNIPSHPQVSDRGVWVNSEPYFYMVLDVQPFGTLNIDRSKITNNSENNGAITLMYDFDIWTGAGFVEVYDGETDDYNVPESANTLLGTLSGNFMVDIPIAQTRTSLTGLLGQGVSAIGEAISSNVSKASTIAAKSVTSFNNVANPVGSFLMKTFYGDTEQMLSNDTSSVSSAGEIISNIGNALTGASTTVSTKGVMGSTIGIRDPFVSCWWTSMIDEDNEQNGRPLCKKVALNTLSGYIQCREGDISLNATQTEKTAVANYLTTGFYRE